MNACKPKRIAVISRRFWPISGPTENFIADLADQFSLNGHRVELFTAAWQKNWPSECSFREFRIHRLSRPASGPWGTYRYQRALTRALDMFQPDAVLLFGNGEDLAPVRKLVGDSIPLAIRIDHRVTSRLNRSANKSVRLNLANAVLLDMERTRNELISRKTPLPGKVVIITDGVRFGNEHQRSLVQQANSRISLGDAHPILRIEAAQPLVVTGATMDGDKGMLDLIKAWKIVLESFPRGKLWVLGDGPKARKVWDEIVDQDMVYSAIMPGYFDDLAEVFQAADLYVQPTRNVANCHCLLSAIANQVCPLVTISSVESVAIRHDTSNQLRESVNVTRDETGVVAPANNPTALGEAITMALRNSEMRANLGTNAAKAFQPAVDIERVSNVFLSALGVVNEAPNVSGASLQ